MLWVRFNKASGPLALAAKAMEFVFMSMILSVTKQCKAGEFTLRRGIKLRDVVAEILTLKYRGSNAFRSVMLLLL
jgi:hypothetical protein